MDHGLGGKDNKKSQQKREKRAKKNKMVAMRALTGGKKKEVIFDEKARTEWLTGFSKRKQERRKFGLAMEVLKKQKEHKEFVKEQRVSVKEARGSTNEASDAESEDEEEESQEAKDKDEKEDEGEVQIYADPSTVSMFGSSVSVVIGTGFEEPEDKPLPKPVVNNKRKQEPSRMEKALKKAKSMMGKKKKHVDNSFEGRKRSKQIQSKVESSKLLYRVTGTYKGSKKGKKH